MNGKFQQIKRKIISLILTMAAALTMLPTVPVFAGQNGDYRDPAEHWLSSSNRTSELDVNAILSHEIFYCDYCEKQTSFSIWRTPEYTKDGQTALSRNVMFSDGMVLDVTGYGSILAGTPGVDATYTGYHWTKACCDTCGVLNANTGSISYGFNKNLYILYDCATEFMEDLDETVSYEFADSSYHKKTTKGGRYCAFCFGTYHSENSVLERHDMVSTVSPEIANLRFAASEYCEDCGFGSSEYIAAKTVITDYYGIADGQPHTLLVNDLSDPGVHTSIRYGTSAGDCSLTSAPNYTEAGQYAVYYQITYTYDNTDMTENGVSYVWLRDESKTNNTEETTGNSSGNSTGNTSSGGGSAYNETHNFTLLDTVPATCTTLGYDLYICADCGEVEKRNYVNALGHNYNGVTVTDANCVTDGRILNICSRCGDTTVTITPKSNHNYSTSTVSASCTAPGYTVRECSICGEKTITAVTPATNHIYDTQTVPATCETGGKITQVCAVCGQVGTIQYVEPTGHDWDASSAVTLSEATCTTTGVRVYPCRNCAQQKYETTPAIGHQPGSAATCTEAQLCTVCGVVLAEKLGHNYVPSVTQPTCSSMGYTTYTCVNCGESYTGDYTNQTGHNYAAAVTPATCINMGYTTYTCVNCGESYVDAYTAELGHNYDAGTTVINSTCNGQGLIEYRCTRCGDTYTESVSATGHRRGAAATCTTAQLCSDCGAMLSPALGHSYRQDVTPTTCTGRGFTTFTCTRCGSSYVGNYTQPLEHNYRASVTSATCTNRGYTTYTCSRCNDSYITDYTAQTSHIWDSGTALSQATCISAGITIYECRNCTANYYVTTPATNHTPGAAATCTQPQLCAVCNAVLQDAKGHNWNSTVVAPTCTTAGYTTRTCTTCGTSDRIEYTPATGHNYLVSVTAATCDAFGFTTHTCANCGDAYTDAYVMAVGHNLDSGTMLTPAACNHNGVTQYKCRNCDYSELEITPLTGHTPGKAATCTQPQICTVCQAILETPVGHQFIAAVTEPTCTDLGFTTYTCRICGAWYKDNYVNSLEHAFTQTVKMATCTEGGFTTYSCVNCGLTYIGNNTDPLGHKLDEGTTVIPSACSSEGLVEYRCERCDYSHFEALTGTGHTPGAPATCTQPQLCTVCGAVLNRATGHLMYANVVVPTCTEIGYTNMACVRGDLAYQTGYEAPLGHNYVATITPATCLEMGYTTFACSRCGESYIDHFTQELGHEWNVGTTLIESSCNSEGMIEYRCVRCDYHYLEPVSASGHVPGNPATCTDPQICEVCGAVMELAHGHDLSAEVTLANCTNVGFTTYTCSQGDLSYLANFVQETGHNYRITVVDATCTTGGYTLHECVTCGDSYLDARVPALGHDLDNGTKITSATCSGDGVIAYRCTRCDYQELEAVSATGHTPGPEATCTTPQTCTVCGAVLVAASSHNYAANVRAATCTADGYTVYVCRDCGQIYRDNFVPATGHSYGKTVTAPTCLESGFTSYICASCGDSYTSDFTPASGHAWGRGTTLIQSSCNSEGMVEYKCNRCDASYLESLAADGHTPGTEATCTTAQLCTVCGAVLAQPTGHNMKSARQEANCLEIGYTTWSCADCDFSYVTEYAQPLGHSYRSVITPATCLEQGYTTFVCTRCNDRYISDYTESLGHAWSDGRTVINSACNHKGMVEHLCTRCLATYLEPLSPSGHNPGPDATCTEPQICLDCGAVLAYATGHIMRRETTPATCTTAGFTVYSCANCDFNYKTDYELPTGHAYRVEITEPTCTNDGFTTRICEYCDDVITENFTAALGHEMDAGTSVTSATCNSQGLVEYSCIRCDYHYLEAVSAEGHTPGAAATCTDPQVCEVCGAVLQFATGHDMQTTVIPATCTEIGYTIYACANCDLIYQNNFTQANGHNYQPVITPPTCLEPGYTTYVCSACGDSYLSDHTEPLGHAWDAGSLVVRTSCNGDGLIDHRCVRCDTHYLEPVSASGHNPGPDATCTEPQICLDCGAILALATGHEMRSNITEAACNEMGYTSYFCANCDYAYNSNYVLPTGHHYQATVTEPTCDAGGFTTYVCANCGDSYAAEYTNPLGHEWNDGTKIIDSTCNGKGMIDHRCVRCDYHYLEAVSAEGHTPGAAATCTDPQVCEVCGAVLQFATGHSMQAKTVPATCLDIGYTDYYCENCDLSYKSDYVQAHGHNYQSNITNATCNDAGFTTFVCDFCGDSYVTNETAALGHHWDSGTVLLYASCTNAGKIDHSCVRCGERYLEEIPANGHISGTAATCTEPELCTVCGAVLANAKGHDMREEITPATCLELGYTTYFCATCGISSRSDYVLPTGHNYQSVVTEPTCLEAGYTTVTCANCGDLYVTDHTEPAGHLWDDGVVIVNISCNQEGLIDRSCMRCGEHSLEAVSPLGHTPGSEATCTTAQICTECGAILTLAIGHQYEAEITAPACVTMGYTTFTCTRCGDRFTGDYTEATGHVESDWIIANEPTTSAEGTRYTACEICGITLKSESMEKLCATAISGFNGEVVVGSYCVQITDASDAPVAGATVTLHGDAARIPQANNRISVLLPDGRLLDYADRITVKVTLVSDGAAVQEMPVTITDRNSNIAYDKTDKNGKTTLPASSARTDSDGRASIGYVDAAGQRQTITVYVSDAESGRKITDAQVIYSSGRLTITLPDGVDMNESDHITITVVDNQRNPVVDLDSTVKGDLGNSASGSTGNDGTITVPVTENKVRHSAYITGYPDGTFRPENSMTRAEATAIFARLLVDKTGDTISAVGSVKFTDVSSDSWYAGYVRYLSGHGIVNGTSEKTFEPDSPITRAEFVTMAVRFFNVYADNEAEAVSKAATFSDVLVGHWATQYILDAAGYGWINGYGDGTFRGGNDITRAEVVTIVNRLLEREADADYLAKNARTMTIFSDINSKHWAYYAVMEAANTHNANLDKGEVWTK